LDRLVRGICPYYNSRSGGFARTAACDHETSTSARLTNIVYNQAATGQL
jgi:hypothetical protein